ncbi:MAG: ComF family protein [Candidatus Thiodiazotropha sp.]
MRFWILKQLIPTLFPQTCLLCGEPGDFDSRFCHACYRELPFNLHACPRCALPLPPGTSSGTLCGHCLKRSSPLDTSVTALRYEAPTNRLISTLKFHQQLHLSAPLARLLIARLGTLDAPPDRILPVPLHALRLKERGFNQAVELGRILSRHYAIPLDLHCVQRIRNTQAQSDLKETARQKNLRKAFLLRRPVKGLKLAILDDVITTGATVRELGRTLKQAGAKHVDVWAIARTVRH